MYSFLELVIFSVFEICAEFIFKGFLVFFTFRGRNGAISFISIIDMQLKRLLDELTKSFSIIVDFDFWNFPFYSSGPFHDI